MDQTLVILFSFLNAVVLPLWLGLLFFSQKKWVGGGIELFTCIAAIVYVSVLVPGLGESFPVIVNPKLDAVQGLLSNQRGAFVGWIHFLIADLWMGRWISSDAAVKGIPRAWVVPILVLTLLFGPAGMLTYLVARRIYLR
jgi:hypothetical protein